MTLLLPPHRLQHLTNIRVEILLSQNLMSVKHWHQILGKLRTMAIAIPGASQGSLQPDAAGGLVPQGHHQQGSTFTAAGHL
jgi:hypothetical protein